MKGWVLTLICCLGLLGQALGQGDTSRYFCIKHNLSLLGHLRHPGLHLAVEYAFAPRFSAQLDGGPQFAWRSSSEPTTQSFQGFRLRPALRYYFTEGGYNNYRLFMELLYEYRQTQAGVEGDFQRETPLGSFQQRLVYDFEERRNTFFFNLGIQQASRGGFLWELGGGLGYFFQNSSTGGVPEDARFITNGGWFWRYGPQERFGYSAMMYFSLGYRF